jgi:hypothetical protein
VDNRYSIPKELGLGFVCSDFIFSRSILVDLNLMVIQLVFLPGILRGHRSPLLQREGKSKFPEYYLTHSPCFQNAAITIRTSSH